MTIEVPNPKLAMMPGLELANLAHPGKARGYPKELIPYGQPGYNSRPPKTDVSPRRFINYTGTEINFLAIDAEDKILNISGKAILFQSPQEGVLLGTLFRIWFDDNPSPILFNTRWSGGYNGGLEMFLNSFSFFKVRIRATSDNAGATRKDAYLNVVAFEEPLGIAAAANEQSQNFGGANIGEDG